MATIANTVFTYETSDVVEDVSSLVTNIDPFETPLLSAMKVGGKPDDTQFGWLQDSLKSPNTGNAVLEGDNITSFEARAPRVRLSNMQQISRKTFAISASQLAVKKHGTTDEYAYQAMLAGKELKTDIESIMFCNQAANGGGDAVARTTAALPAYLKTNVNKASDGENPTYTTIPDDTRTDGTQRDLTEAMVLGLMEAGWNRGANFKTISVGSNVKSRISATFEGIVPTMVTADSVSEEVGVTTAVDIYKTDFGTVRIRMNRWQRTRDLWILDPAMLSVRYLRPYFTKPLPESVDGKLWAMIVEWGTQCAQEKGLALVADLTTNYVPA